VAPVPAAHRLLGDLFGAGLDAVPGQCFEDGEVALVPALAEPLETVLQRTGLGLQPQDQEMHAPVELEGQFGAGDQFDVVMPGGFPGFGYAVQGVVIEIGRESCRVRGMWWGWVL